MILISVVISVFGALAVVSYGIRTAVFIDQTKVYRELLVELKKLNAK